MKSSRTRLVTFGVAAAILLMMLTACGASLTEGPAGDLTAEASEEPRQAQPLALDPGGTLAFAQLGSSVAVDGAVAAVTSLGSQVGGKGVGSLHLYDLASGEMGLIFEEASPAPGSRFGDAVAVDGSTVAVGAPHYGEGRSGAVYIYQLIDGEWRRGETITAPSSVDLGYFGEALALSGEVLAVGAPGPGDGSVYLFERSGSRWAHSETLSPTQPSSGERRFGSTLALGGAHLAVGAWTSREGESGAVHLYREVGGSWQEERTVESPEAGDRFGFALALDENTLAVGAPGGARGAVHLFSFTAAGWSGVGQLQAPATGDTGFGTALAFGDGVLAVASPTSSVAPFGNGRVHIYSGAGGTWAHSLDIPSGSSVADAEFGSSLAASGEVLVVGAPGDGAQPLQGAAYLLDLGQRGARE